MKPPNLIIHANAVFTPESLRSALSLAKSSISREIRLGRLRVAKRGGRYFLLGRWIIQWLREGEVRRKRSDEVSGVSGAKG
jgi:hypothetical protein